MENLISVIVITYNQEKTIGRTLDAILMQRCHLSIEIELRDDCSKDATDAICRKYANKYPSTIRYRRNEKNKGVIDNYYDTLLECRGKYIADCAGDDYWIDVLKLEKESRILEEHEDVTLVHTAWNRYDNNKHTVIRKENSIFTSDFTDGRRMLEDIICQTSNPVIHLCTSLYRKDIFLKAYQKDRYLFTNKDFNCEDLQLAFMMAYYGKIAYLQDVTLNYGIEECSISNTKDEKKLFFFFTGATDLCAYLTRKYHITSDKTTTFFTERMHKLYMHAFRANCKELKLKADEMDNQWQVNLKYKTKFIRWTMSHSVLWKLLSIIRMVYISFAKH